MTMHPDELPLDDETARRLIADRLPDLRDAGIRRLATTGTTNAIFRIGTELTARFPLRPADPEHLRAALEREAAALGELHRCCPVPAPRPVAIGEPGHGFPLPWSVQTWVPGTVATHDGLAASEQLARDLAGLIRSLRAVPVAGRERAAGGNSGHLPDSDAWMETCFRNSEGLLPVGRLRALWAEFRALPAPRETAMTHGDLIPGNLLVEGERLSGVLDGGAFAPNDPSIDLVAAWHLLDADRRALLRRELGCGDIEWRRGAAWAFHQAMGLVWYYRDTNPPMCALGRSTLTRILDDPLFAGADPREQDTCCSPEDGRGTPRSGSADCDCC